MHSMHTTAQERRINPFGLDPVLVPKGQNIKEEKERQKRLSGARKQVHSPLLMLIPLNTHTLSFFYVLRQEKKRRKAKCCAVVLLSPSLSLSLSLDDEGVNKELVVSQ